MAEDRVICGASTLTSEGVDSCRERSDFVVLSNNEEGTHTHSCTWHLGDVVESFHADFGCPVMVITEDCDGEPCTESEHH